MLGFSIVETVRDTGADDRWISSDIYRAADCGRSIGDADAAPSDE